MKFTSAAAIIALLSAAAPFAAKADDESSNMVERVLRQRQRDPKGKKSYYEVWASDQSNSVPGETSAGVKGSYLWIWDSSAIQEQLNGGTDAKPLSCTTAPEGPCDLLDIFPQDLTDGTGGTLGSLPAFGRLHGVIKDPQNLYVNANIFAPGGGYVGIIDTETKEAIGLFRVTETDFPTGPKRSVHMSFWTPDGSAIIVDNLNGKMIERINVTRDNKGRITNLEFDKSAGVYLGKDFSLQAEASAFSGNNAFGRSLIGSVVGDYANAGKSCCAHCQFV